MGRRRLGEFDLQLQAAEPSAARVLDLEAVGIRQAQCRHRFVNRRWRQTQIQQSGQQHVAGEARRAIHHSQPGLGGHHT
jgi:hypothetical protein